MGDGDDGVTVGGGDAARAEARRVVGEVAGVRAAIGGGEGQVLSVGAVGEAGCEADDQGQERERSDGEDNERAAGEVAPRSGFAEWEYVGLLLRVEGRGKRFEGDRDAGIAVCGSVMVVALRLWFWHLCCCRDRFANY